MASKVHGGLGKGLGALLQSTPVTSVPPGEKVQEIKVSDIRANRYQPRQDFDEGALEELKESIKSYGVLQPVLVRKLPEEGSGSEIRLKSKGTYSSSGSNAAVRSRGSGSGSGSGSG